MKRTLLCLALILALLVSLAVPACAAGSETLEAADYLHSLGLFNGVGVNPDGSPDYGLDRAPTRQEAVAMLIRLLGKEEEAMAGTWETPFTDVSPWAEPYVGYAYANGLTNGMSATTFGGNLTVSAAQYLTFVLRALGYSSETDFSWSAAWEKTDALGVTDGSYTAANSNSFLRGDAALVSAFALGTAKKGGAERLLDGLVAEGAVSAEAARTSIPPQRSLESQYRVFARQLLAEGGTETVLSVDADRVLFEKELTKVASAYDAYSIPHFPTSPSSPALRETLLADALKAYATECMDGDYSRNLDQNSTSQFSDAADVVCVLLTDRKGAVVAYGFWYEETPEEIAMVSCKRDSRPLIDAARTEFDRQFETLTVVSCEAAWEDSRIVYHFSGIPENAVRMKVAAYGASQSGVFVSIKKHLSLFRIAMQNHPDAGISIENPYSEPALYKRGEWASCFTLFVFMDANKELVGYCLATYS